tara:strand:- start:209 stop:628 length:420 start_codon:yes stop_codon:yes gene_type:complete
MERNKLIDVISDELSIDKNIIFEDANLSLLCILSHFLKEDNENKKIKINRIALSNHTPLEYTKDKGGVSLDLTFLFENCDHKRIKYNYKRGRDGFSEYDMIQLLLMFAIEDKFKIQIHDDQIASFYTVGHILSYIKDNL